MKPGPVFGPGHILHDVGHGLQELVVVAQLLRGAVPPLEILGAVDAHAIGAEIHLCGDCISSRIARIAGFW